jgi:hypothetical protein
LIAGCSRSKMVRRFDPYHEIEEPMERRMDVVRLHSQRVS